MNIDELLEFDSSQWDKLTEEQLFAIFKPSLTVTRPELAPRAVQKQRTEPVIKNMTPGKSAALQALQMEGLDLSFLQRRRKK